MKVVNIVKAIKQIHLEYIVLIKIGKFYYSYSKDAYIVSYIFNYKLKIVEENIKVCAFPVFVQFFWLGSVKGLQFINIYDKIAK